MRLICKCKRCGVQLRVVRGEHRFKGDILLVCDLCAVATVAPRSMHDFLTELEQCQS